MTIDPRLELMLRESYRQVTARGHSWMLGDVRATIETWSLENDDDPARAAFMATATQLRLANALALDMLDEMLEHVADHDSPLYRRLRHIIDTLTVPPTADALREPGRYGQLHGDKGHRGNG